MLLKAWFGVLRSDGGGGCPLVVMESDVSGFVF